MAHDSTAFGHQEWIGYVQPVGVVVSTPALLEAGAAINRNFVPLHRAFLAVLPQDREGNPIPELTNFAAFATDVLGWQVGDLTAPSDRFSVPLPGYDDHLQPTWVVNDGGAPILLVLETRGDFDRDAEPEPRHWNAAPQLRFERLLRETGVPAGLLVSPQAIRLVYAPKGETSGHITFKIGDMVQVAGRPMLAALHMLLSSERLFSLATEQCDAHALRIHRGCGRVPFPTRVPVQTGGGSSGGDWLRTGGVHRTATQPDPIRCRRGENSSRCGPPAGTGQRRRVDDREFRLRLCRREGPTGNRARPATCGASFEGGYRFCGRRRSCGGSLARPVVRLPAFLSVDGAVPGWKAGLHAAPQRDRTPRARRNRRPPHGSVRPLLHGAQAGLATRQGLAPNVDRRRFGTLVRVFKDLSGAGRKVCPRSHDRFDQPPMASTSLWLWSPGLESDRTARTFRLRRRSWHGTPGSLSWPETAWLSVESCRIRRTPILLGNAPRL